MELDRKNEYGWAVKTGLIYGLCWVFACAVSNSGVLPF